MLCFSAELLCPELSVTSFNSFLNPPYLVHSVLLRMYQIIDLAALTLFPIPLTGLRLVQQLKSTPNL